MEEISIAELLKRTAAIISDLEIPVKLADQIARPLYVALGNLNQCIEALEKEGDGNGV